MKRPDADGWNFNCSEENEARLKPLCQEVERHFELPAHKRLYRYFATSEEPAFAHYINPNYRAFHCSHRPPDYFPLYVINCFYPRDTENNSKNVNVFDDLIYIRHSTCFDSTGCIEAYAHELQHFIQHGYTPRLLHVNRVLFYELKNFEPSATVIDIPSEKDANIVSKRVAELVCGVNAVRAFAEEQIQVMQRAGRIEERDRWIFFRDVPSSTPYDLLESTLPLVERYKGRIDFGVNVDEPEWWVGPLKSCGRTISTS